LPTGTQSSHRRACALWVLRTVPEPWSALAHRHHKTATLLRFHVGFKDFKYRFLYSPSPKQKPGPKGLSRELIRAICELKQRNPRFGCPKIAQHLAKAFGIEIDKDVVRRVLAVYYRPERRGQESPWLTLLGHTKDSLWSLDLFRTESILLRSHWVLSGRALDRPLPRPAPQSR